MFNVKFLSLVTPIIWHVYCICRLKQFDKIWISTSVLVSQSKSINFIFRKEKYYFSMFVLSKTRELLEKSILLRLVALNEISAPTRIEIQYREEVVHYHYYHHHIVIVSCFKCRVGDVRTTRCVWRSGVFSLLFFFRRISDLPHPSSYTGSDPSRGSLRT